MITFPIGIITDTHLHKNNIDLVTKVMDQFMLECMNKGIKTVVHVGDVFDERPKIEIEVYLAWRRIIKRFWGNGLYFYVIPGNHDKQNQTQEESHLTLFEDTPQFFVQSSFDFELGEKNNVFYFMPFFPVKQQIKILENMSDNHYTADINILFIHGAINGAKNNDGTIIDNGIDQELLERFDLVIAGHYHNRRQLSSNIWYIGSGYQANFSEDKDKGYVILNEDLSLEFHPLEFPKYLTYPVYLDILSKKDFDLIFKYTKEHHQDKIRVKLGAPYEEQDFSLTDELADLGVRLEYPLPKIETAISNFKSLSKIDIKDIFKNFSKKNNIIKEVVEIIERYI